MGVGGCTEGTKPVAAMTHEEKMEAAIKMSNLAPEILGELGDLRVLVGSIVVVGGILAASAATGAGAVVEAIAAILLLAGLYASGSQIADGIDSLHVFYIDTRCDIATTEYELQRAGDKFGDGVAKIGVGTVMMILTVVGGRKLAKARRARITSVASKYGIKNLPKDPNKLLEAGWKETTHPEMKANSGSREFVDPKSGMKARHDPGKPGANGWEGEDHYHVENPSSTGKGDRYLDVEGNPVPKGSNKSHIEPSE